MTAAADKNTNAKGVTHPYHIVDPSPWPFLMAMSLLVLAIGAVLAMHDYGFVPFAVGIAFLVFCFVGWVRDVSHEADTQASHTKEVRHSLRLGFALFIVTELMLFVSLFWAFFHASLAPPDAINNIWPPKNIETMDAFSLPYFNTLLLLLSGTTITWAHHALLQGRKKELVQGLGLTVFLGLTFLSVQALEYMHAPFAFTDGIYPSTFYLATGFHGAHVLIGSIFLIVCFFRAKADLFSPEQHVGFETAAWYWHFVDVVWLFLFVSIYWWGS